MELNKIYRHRFSPDDVDQMNAVWRVLVEGFFQKWVPENSSVLDIGAGTCLFINNIKAQHRVAYDLNPETSKFCAPDVRFFGGDFIEKIEFPMKFDCVFMSNFLEHMDDNDAVLKMLGSAGRLLKPGGQILILQPNFALTGAKYFDFIDHKVILTDKSLVEALELEGYDVEYLKKRFLPYTSKSALPRSAWLVWLYLKLPFAQWLLGEQTFVVARKSGGA